MVAEAIGSRRIIQVQPMRVKPVPEPGDIGRHPLPTPWFPRAKSAIHLAYISPPGSTMPAKMSEQEDHPERLVKFSFTVTDNRCLDRVKPPGVGSIGRLLAQARRTQVFHVHAHPGAVDKLLNQACAAAWDEARQRPLCGLIGIKARGQPVGELAQPLGYHVTVRYWAVIHSLMPARTAVVTPKLLCMLWL